MADSKDERKTVHLSVEQHDSVVETAFMDGRVPIRQWIAEAVSYYLDRTPATRASYRRKLKRKELDG